MDHELVIREASPFDPDVSVFIDKLDRLHDSLYPASSNHLDSRQTLSNPNCKFLGAYKNGKLVGTGAAKILDGYAELKRFFVSENARGQGVADCIIAVLEKWLIEKQIPFARLETGIYQPPAIELYKRLGYKIREPFAGYKADPLSLFMEKALKAEDGILKKHSNPYFLVAFGSKLKEPSELYDKTSGEMVSLAQEQPGFVGIHSVRGDDGVGFTASYWQDRDAIRAWGMNAAHRKAQQLGHTTFYSQFRITVAKVEV